LGRDRALLVVLGRGGVRPRLSKPAAIIGRLVRFSRGMTDHLETTHLQTEITLHCMTCGYDLNTLPVKRKRVRCPECGEQNDMSLLLRRSNVRQLRQRSTDRDMTVFVGLSVTTAFVAALGGAAGMQMRTELLFTKAAGLVAVAFLYAVVLVVLRFVEASLLWWERAVLAGVGFALLVIVDPPLSLLFVALWWLAFRWRSLQGYE